MGSSYVKFRSEISSIRDYLEIEHLRFGDKFNFELITNELEEIQGLEVFPGLVQPFIENAIWHGVRPLEQRKGIIRVVFSEINKGMIQCIIEDDGIGRKASSELNKGSALHNSMGISIVNERLNIISKLRGVTYHLAISDISPEEAHTGTRIILQIPSRFAY
jgi:LytS/YehU family sensor histidine kinase